MPWELNELLEELAQLRTRIELEKQHKRSLERLVYDCNWKEWSADLRKCHYKIVMLKHSAENYTGLLQEIYGIDPDEY